MENKDTRYLNVLKCISSQLQSVLLAVPEKIKGTVVEISLRVNRPLCIECPDKRYYFTKNSCITDTLLDSGMIMVTQRDVFDTFQNICNYSIYSRQNEINSGFVTIKGGHRAGICGTAVVSDGQITNVKNVSSLNIRIAREIHDCSNSIFNRVDVSKGVLICGAPCSGKTTLIRDYARKLSYTYKVSVIDERNELSATINGVAQNDIGLCDVFDNYVKSEAITHAVRNMSPDIVVCDEIATIADVESVQYCVNCGVSFIATMHCSDIDSLLKRDYAKKILSTCAFNTIVFLNSRHNVGQIKDIVDFESIGGEMLA